MVYSMFVLVKFLQFQVISFLIQSISLMLLTIFQYHNVHKLLLKIHVNMVSLILHQFQQHYDDQIMYNQYLKQVIFFLVVVHLKFFLDKYLFDVLI